MIVHVRCRTGSRPILSLFFVWHSLSVTTAAASAVPLERSHHIRTLRSAERADLAHQLPRSLMRSERRATEVRTEGIVRRGTRRRRPKRPTPEPTPKKATPEPTPTTPEPTLATPEPAPEVTPSSTQEAAESEPEQGLPTPEPPNPESLLDEGVYVLISNFTGVALKRYGSRGVKVEKPPAHGKIPEEFKWSLGGAIRRHGFQHFRITTHDLTQMLRVGGRSGRLRLARAAHRYSHTRFMFRPRGQLYSIEPDTRGDSMFISSWEVQETGGYKVRATKSGKAQSKLWRVLPADVGWQTLGSRP